MSTLTSKPGITVIKAGSVKMNDLSKTLDVQGLVSHISEQAVTEKADAMAVGHFTMKPGAGLEYTYNNIECKVVTKGRIVMHDKQGNKYVAETGDVIVFSPDVVVLFDGESDCEAVYLAHRELDQDFASPA